MSHTVEPHADATVDASLRHSSRRSLGLRGVLLIFLAILALLSFIRVVTGANDLTSAGTVAAAIGLSVPIAMAGLGGLWSERAGVVNIGLEGMLVLGTFGAGWAGYLWGPWAGLVVGVVMGALGGLIHAIATVTFAVDQIVSGVAINILALGVTQYLASVLFEGVEGGGPTQSPPMESMGTITIPGLSPFLLDVASQGWFLVSDLAAVVAGMITNVSYLTVLAVLLIVATYYLLWRTAFGLRLRSVGEAPHAAATLGVRVRRYKYIAVVVSGALAGVGGVFLAEVLNNIYREGQTAGRGYIGLAAMIFGNWRPGGLAAGAGLFGFADALQLRGAEAVHALLLAAALVLALWGIWLLVRRRRAVSGLVSLAVGGLLALWYFSTESLPPQVTFVTPYVTTLVVLALATQRLRMPAADGKPYREGEE